MEKDMQDMCCVCFHTFRKLFPLGLMREVLTSLLGRTSKYCEKLHSSNSRLCWECYSILNKLYQFKKVINRSQDYYRDIRLLKISKISHLTVNSSQLNCTPEKNNDHDYVLLTKSEIKDESSESLQSNFNTESDAFTVSYPPVIENTENTSFISPEDDTNYEKISVTIPPLNENYILIPLASTSGETKPQQPVITESDEETISIPSIITHDVNEDRSDLFPLLCTYTRLKRRYDIIVLTEEEIRKERIEKYKNLKYEPFFCRKCLQNCHSSQQLKKHNETAHRRKSDNEVLCELCHTYVLNTVSGLSAHRRAHYVRYKCKICSVIYEKTNQIGFHMYTHKERGCKKFRCMHCFYTFDEEKCEKHPSARIIQNVQCDYCKKYFKQKQLLLQHIQRLHSEVEIVKCHICSKNYKGPEYLQIHIRRTHGEKKPVTEFFYCKDCDVQFQSKHGLRLHLKTSKKHIQSDDIFVCEFCKKRFCTKKSYACHKRLYHSNNPCVCDLCGKKLINETVLKRHKLTQHDKVKIQVDRNFICDQCGKGFPARKILHEHARMHSDLRPFACSLCSATFKYSSVLYTHMKLVHKMKKKQQPLSRLGYW